MYWNDDLPLLAFWSKAHSPYICIEPWMGCSDFVDDKINELGAKLGAKILKPGESYEIVYGIEFI